MLNTLTLSAYYETAHGQSTEPDEVAVQLINEKNEDSSKGTEQLLEKFPKLFPSTLTY